jgi:hypothetical protein
MVKKVIGYLLLCCFSNVLTTLPAKCCDSSAFIHQHSSKTPAHSQTVLQYLLDIMSDDSSPGNTGIDVHCSVFNETFRPVSIQSTQFLCAAGSAAITTPADVAVIHSTYHPRRFPVPQHHDFLFRLTPF